MRKTRAGRFQLLLNIARAYLTGHSRHAVRFVDAQQCTDQQNDSFRTTTPNQSLVTRVYDGPGEPEKHVYLMLQYKYESTPRTAASARYGEGITSDTDNVGVQPPLSTSTMLRMEGTYEMVWYLHMAGESGRLKRQQGIVIINDHMLQLARLHDGTILIEGFDKASTSKVYDVGELEAEDRFWGAEFGTSLTGFIGMAAFTAQVQAAAFKAAADLSMASHDTFGAPQSPKSDPGKHHFAGPRLNCTDYRYSEESLGDSDTSCGLPRDNPTADVDLPIEHFRSLIKESNIRIRLVPKQVMRMIALKRQSTGTMDEVECPTGATAPTESA